MGNSIDRRFQTESSLALLGRHFVVAGVKPCSTKTLENTTREIGAYMKSIKILSVIVLTLSSFNAMAGELINTPECQNAIGVVEAALKNNDQKMITEALSADLAQYDYLSKEVISFSQDLTNRLNTTEDLRMQRVIMDSIATEYDTLVELDPTDAPALKSACSIIGG